MAHTQRINWLPSAVTLMVAVLAFAVQWGAVWTKLDQVEKRLDEFIIEARSLRTQYQAMARRVAYLEGRHGIAPGDGDSQP
jgi:Tfp pilus assembly protein PilO